jgi:hypothetical protein
VRAILLHQTGETNANVRWVPTLPPGYEHRLAGSLEGLRKRGYFASPMPEGDGVSIRHQSYDDEEAFEDIAAAFPWLSFDESDASKPAAERLNRLNSQRSVAITYLVPAETLLIDQTLTLGPYVIHRPIVPHEHTVAAHPWAMEFLDVPGADVDPVWDPRSAPHDSLARYLGFPLIEGHTEVNGALLFPVGAGVVQQEPLALQITEHADRVLDVLRYRYCNQDRPQLVPQHAGVLTSSFRAAYLIPQVSDIEPGLVVAKSQAFEALNVWLGLEADAGVSADDIRLATIASGECASEVEQRIRAGLRSRGQSFLLVNPEMRFVSLVFAVDAIAAVGHKKGNDQRRHVAAVGSNGKKSLFAAFLASIQKLYRVRNRIVHEGASFAEQGEDPITCLTGIDRIMTHCIHAALRSSWKTTKDIGSAVDVWLKTF